MSLAVSSPLIRRRLVQARNRFNRLRVLQHGGTLLTVAALGWFALLYSVERSWLTSRPLYQSLLAGGILLLAVAGVLLVLITLSRRRKATFLAGAIEGARPGLLDRLNTLVFLDHPANAKARQTFYTAIAQQTATLLQGRASGPLYPRLRALAHVGVGLAGLAGTYWFAKHYNPTRNLRQPSEAVARAVAPPMDAPFELNARNTAEVAGQEAWGEVRIVEPGRDQKLTKLDVVPLQIEMAARDPLATHEWITSVNGGPEAVHNLDAAPEPCFAAYSVLFYLDELKVSDWDLVSYYARAATTKKDAYASQIYFIEIRPFRDDLLKSLPGGAGGKAYQMLNDLSELANEQSRLLRATHQHEQMNYTRPELQTEDRRKLASAEGDLAVATNHVYGKMASSLENVDIGIVLSHLDAAEDHMNRSSGALRSDVVSEGKSRQQQALTELAATRKALQKAISDNPGAFGSDGGDDEQPPVADQAKSTLKALQQVAEYRNKEKAVQAAMAKLAAEEKRLAALPNKEYEKRGKELAKQQKQMGEQLDDLAHENPGMFAHAKETLEATRQEMREAEKNLADKETYDASTSLMHASDGLNDLNKSLNAGNAQRELERAYALKKAVDQSAQALHAAESKPDALTPGQADALANGARQATRTLKEMGAQGFGPDLAESLSPGKQAELDAALQKFQSGKGSARAQAAAEARGNLEGVSKAFDASRPALVRQLAGQDTLGGRSSGNGQGQGSGEGAIDALLEKLQSLALQDQNGHQLSPQDRAKQRGQLLGEMERTLPRELGKTDAAALLAEARQELTKKSDQPVNAEALQRLQEKLEHMQASAAEKKAATQAVDGASVADASRAPASYRQRLQRYYEALSRIKP